MGTAQGLWHKVALRDAGPSEIQGEGQSVPVDLLVTNEASDEVVRPISGERCVRAPLSGPQWSSPADAVLHGPGAPGLRVASTDPHIVQLGAWSMVGFHVTPLEMYDAWSKGRIVVGRPRKVRVHVNGPLAAYADPEDVAMALLADVPMDAYADAVLEFQGDAVDGMRPESRGRLLAAASLTGCRTALAPSDESTFEAARRRGMAASLSLDQLRSYRPDDEAAYDELVVINADEVPARIAHAPTGAIQAFDAYAGRKVRQVIIGGCATGGAAMLARVADELEGQQVHPDVRMDVVADSARTHALVAASDVGMALDSAGAHLVPPDEVARAAGGVCLTDNPCLAPAGLVAGLGTLVATATRGHVSSWGMA